MSGGGTSADKPTVLTLIELCEMEKESNKYDIQTLAADVFRKVREQQLTDFHRRMPDGKKGVEVEIGGRKFVAAIRRLTPQECAKLQTVPENYEFVSSET